MCQFTSQRRRKAPRASNRGAEGEQKEGVFPYLSRGSGVLPVQILKNGSSEVRFQPFSGPESNVLDGLHTALVLTKLTIFAPFLSILKSKQYVLYELKYAIATHRHNCTSVITFIVNKDGCSQWFRNITRFQ